MLIIRLSRTGKTRQPSFRIVVIEKKAPPRKNFIELLGHYRPANQPKVFEAKKERIEYWISKGAKPSDTAAVLFKNYLKMEGMEKYLEPRNKKRLMKKEGGGKSAEAEVEQLAAKPA